MIFKIKVVKIKYVRARKNPPNKMIWNWHNFFSQLKFEKRSKADTKEHFHLSCKELKITVCIATAITKYS